MDEMDSSAGKFRYFILIPPVFCSNIFLHFLSADCCILSGNRYPAFVSVTYVRRFSNSPVALTLGKRDSDDGEATRKDGLLVFGELTMLLIVT